MKVLFCKGQTMGPISGADELLVTYATRLLGAGVNVSVPLMFSQNGDPYHDRLRRAGVPVTGLAERAAVGGIPDMLGLDAGLLVPVGDVEELAGAMMRLAGDPTLRASMGRAGRARYEATYSPQAVLPLLLETYQRLRGRAESVPLPRCGHLTSARACGESISS